MGGKKFIIIKITTLDYRLYSVLFSGFNIPCPDFHFLKGKNMITVHHRLQLIWTLKLCLFNIPGAAEKKKIDVFYKSNTKISPTTFRRLYMRSRKAINVQAGNTPKSKITTS